MRPVATGRGELPSAFMIQMRAVPPSVDANAIARPSEDQTPATLNALRNVNCLGDPPAAGIVYRLARDSYPMLKTTNSPSGETRGRSAIAVPCVSCLVRAGLVPAGSASTSQRFA